MKDFILNLIKKGKLESEELLSNTNLKNRQTAFLEAMAACPPGNHLDEFHFRWLKIKGIDATFPILIALISNHLKWTSS